MADLNRVVQILKENKVEEKDIAAFITNLNNVMAQQIEIELISTLGEDDFAKLNKMDEATAHVEISKRYQEISGNSIEQKSDQMLDGFVTGFLTEYQRQKLKEKKS